MFWPFKRKKPIETPQPETVDEQADLPVVDENGNPEDPILAALVNEAWRSGGMVVGNVDDEGNLTIERST